MKVTAIFATAMLGQVAPHLPSLREVFSTPEIEQDIQRFCKNDKYCKDSQRFWIEKLLTATDSPATTGEQRYKILSMLDEMRGAGSVNFDRLTTDYFIWRRKVTGAEYVPAPPPRRPTYTAECRSSYGKDYSTTRCTSSY